MIFRVVLLLEDGDDSPTTIPRHRYFYLFCNVSDTTASVIDRYGYKLPRQGKSCAFERT